MEIIKGGRAESITQSDIENVLVLLNQQERRRQMVLRAAGSIIRRLKAGSEAEGGPREIEFRETFVNGVMVTTLYIDSVPRVHWADGEIGALRGLLGGLPGA